VKIFHGALIPLLAITIFYFQSCQSNQPPALVEHFTPITFSDTIHVSPDSVEQQQAENIPLSDFFAALDSSLLNQFIYPPDTLDMQVYGHWRLPIDETFDACLLEVQQSWFVFKYLLMYSNAAQQFTDLLLAAQFYGGEGGQVRIESWLFDWGDEDTPQILSRISEHALIMSEGEMKDTYEESVELRQWQQGAFQEMPVQDSNRWIQAYPIEW
jgi:hypothetical protein